MTAKKKSPATPSLRLHKLSGRGFVELEGRRIYLGPWDEPGTTALYFRTVAEWASNGYRLPVPQDEITVDELIAQYVSYAKEYYVHPQTGEPSGFYEDVNKALQAVQKLYGDMPAISFGPKALRAVRQAWIDKDLSISTINSRVGSIRLCFKWACSNELIPVEVHQALCTLTGLRRGRGLGKDPVDRLPAPEPDIEKALEYLPGPLAAVVRLQLLTGARPSEILNLTPGQIECAGETWIATITHHKNSHRGKQRRIPFGQRCQAILRPYMLRGKDCFLFSPKEALRERRETARTGKGRRENQKPNSKATDRVVGDCYDHRAYGRAVRLACKKAGVPNWCPYRLRHSAATNIAKKAGLAVAGQVLQHQGLEQTSNYADHHLAVSMEWAKAHG